MLDQNTDRMWYVIGAVIVGAAIIFLVNNSFPQLFASVGDTFTKSVGEVSKTIDGINDDSINENVNLTGKLYSYEDGIRERNGLDLKLQSNGIRYEGMYIHSDVFKLDRTNKISFDIQKTSGDILTLGGHISNSEVTEVKLDGVVLSDNWNTGVSNVYPNDSKVHHVEILIKPVTGGYLPEYEKHVFIQPNRHANLKNHPVSPYTVWIRNIQVQIVN